MLLNFVIAVIAAVCLIRTLSYAIWCFREKKVFGGISVLFLTLCAGMSLIFIF